MKSRIIVLILLIGFVSCNLDSAMDFRVINNSANKISEIRISASGSSVVETIELNDSSNSVDYKLNKSNLPPVDGSYNIEFKRDGQIENKSFGYYTNGYPLNKKYIIEIMDNELSIKEE